MLNFQELIELPDIQYFDTIVTIAFQYFKLGIESIKTKNSMFPCRSQIRKVKIHV